MSLDNQQTTFNNQQTTLNNQMDKLWKSRAEVIPSIFEDPERVTLPIIENQKQTIYLLLSDIINGANTELSNVNPNLPITPRLDFSSLKSKAQSEIQEEEFQQLAELKVINRSERQRLIDLGKLIPVVKGTPRDLSDTQIGKFPQPQQEGGEIEVQPPIEEQADTQLDMAGLGPLGLVDDMEGETITGVADDLEMELPEGSYVLNAHTVELVGVKDLNTMIKDAITIAVESGYKLPKEVDPTKKVPIQISNGEFVIPAILVPIIGLENLEKMNRRGLEYREQQEAEVRPEEGEPAPEGSNEDLIAQIKDVA